MLPDEKIEALHRKYAPSSKVYDLVYTHCRIVWDIAEWCVDHNDLKADKDLLRNACLLHDIGTYALYDAEGTINNHALYPQHAILGAKIVLDEGLDPRVSQAIETHVLMGLTKEEIMNPKRPWPLPARDYVPASLEAELLCYADRFHTKRPVFNSFENFRDKLAADLPLQAKKFEEAVARFGLPDLGSLAETYGHPLQ